MPRSISTPCIIDYVMAFLVTNIIYSRIWPCAYKHFWSKNIFRNNKSTQNTMSIQTGRTRLWLQNLYRAPGSKLLPARLLSLTSWSACARYIIVYVTASLINNVLDNHNTLKCFARNNLFYHNRITLLCLCINCTYVICSHIYIWSHL